MWLLIALFAALLLFGFALESLPNNAIAWWFLAFLLTLVSIPGLFVLALFAFFTIRCGECHDRFFDVFFLSFPVQGGCQGCCASINSARTRRLRDIGQQ
jgi:hypothetical protein